MREIDLGIQRRSDLFMVCEFFSVIRSDSAHLVFVRQQQFYNRIRYNIRILATDFGDQLEAGLSFCQCDQGTTLGFAHHGV